MPWWMMAPRHSVVSELDGQERNRLGQLLTNIDQNTGKLNYAAIPPVGSTSKNQKSELKK